MEINRLFWKYLEVFGKEWKKMEKSGSK